MKPFIFLYAVSIILVFTACSKNDEKLSIFSGEKPLAKAEYDNSNFGIYKGGFTGPMGTVLININNEGNINAKLKVDGKDHYFTTTQIAAQNQLTTINFTEGANSFTFKTLANGDSAQVTNINVAGYPNAQMSLVKEKSKLYVFTYGGNYSGPGENGGMYLVLSASSSQTGGFEGGLLHGKAWTTVNDPTTGRTYNFLYDITGYASPLWTVNMTAIDTGPGSSQIVTTLIGEFSGNPFGTEISGTFSNSNESGIWSVIKD